MDCAPSPGGNPPPDDYASKDLEELTRMLAASHRARREATQALKDAVEKAVSLTPAHGVPLPVPPEGIDDVKDGESLEAAVTKAHERRRRAAKKLKQSVNRAIRPSTARYQPDLP